MDSRQKAEFGGDQPFTQLQIAHNHLLVNDVNRWRVSRVSAQTLDEEKMKTMIVEWQRLIDKNGQTCDRCACTGDATQAAVDKLKRCLSEIGIEVILKNRIINHSDFIANPIQSNQISIDGRPIETWLNASSGQSPCCGPCGDIECRTILVDGRTYEAIPETVILRAGLLAAAEKLNE